MKEILKKYGTGWIPCKKGSFPEDILPQEYLTKYPTQSFPVLYGTDSKDREVVGRGIRTVLGGKYCWDNKKSMYVAWKLREDMKTAED